MAEELIKMDGMDNLKKLLGQFGPEVAQAAGKAGVRKSANVIKKSLQSASPYKTGSLKKDWIVKKLRSRWKGEFTDVVRLKERFYYELLEFEGIEPGQRKRAGGGSRQFAQKRGGMYHPFAARAIQNVRRKATQMIVDGTRDAIAFNAGKIHAKSLRRR